MGALDSLRRGYPLNDLVEAAAARRTVAAALAEHDARAVVFSTVTATMLAPRLEVPYAVRLDSPAALNRPGLRNTPLHALERQGLGGARVVLPWSRAALAALPPGASLAVVLPPPIAPSGPPDGEPERLAVAYVPDPKAKGLDLLCAAWAAANLDEARLAVFGIEEARARGYLRRAGIRVPPGVEWRGMAAASEFRAALRRCRAFVSAARWEDFGQAPLEGLADGATLVTAPAGGAYEALGIAQELAPELVADSTDPASLGPCLEKAFAMDDARRAAYREAALATLEPYRPESLVRALRDHVLPALLG
jgi:glycosyltransferase involved in cell wall biosynthesis